MAFKDILKKIGGFYMSVFGIDTLAKSDEGQAIQDSANDIAAQFGRGPIFQTKKVKERAERCAQEQERRNIEATAENTRRIAEALEELNRKI